MSEQTPAVPHLEGGTLSEEISEQVVGKAREAVSHWPRGRCDHKGARLICTSHVNVGVLCVNCSAEHHATHSLRLDSTCEACAETTINVRKAWAQVGRYLALVRLCPGCRNDGGVGE